MNVLVVGIDLFVTRDLSRDFSFAQRKLSHCHKKKQFSYFSDFRLEVDIEFIYVATSKTEENAINMQKIAKKLGPYLITIYEVEIVF